MAIDPKAPWLLVDLSNVCRDQQLIPSGAAARWSAFERVLDALSRSPVTFRDVFAIADRSLLSKLGPEDKRAVRRMEAERRLDISELADERLLAYAFDSDSPFRGSFVASLDNFDDFRRRYPEIQGSTGRFVGWRASRSGAVEVFLRDMGIHTHNALSRKEEVGELKARHIRRAEILERATAEYFACSNRMCIVAQLWPVRLRELPKYDDRRDRFVCPACGDPVEPRGRRPHSAQLIVFLDGDERLRILIEAEELIAIGREDSKGCIGLGRRIPRDRVASVSRRHVSFGLIGGSVEVQDLASKNGTWIQGRRSGKRRRLAPDKPATLSRTETILLPEGITIELSGRSAPLEGERIAVDAPTEPRWADPVTRLAGSPRTPDR